ncbi:hypothetical protein B0681_09155 [Moraxella porci DSM 25326]|uniref:Uncharacterized protein n=1 Tax=Moraxella porci DSM 25326 TaxID=573983 RepID=A0A1T0CN93_9GAMM|nr:hypothetical protein [Moraxella porci]OOS23783.1 hypothetical protein B0681_09155 [Moraxella porci DSM 25326]
MELALIAFLTWVCSNILLFILYRIHYAYAVHLLGDGYWIGWEISWEFFLGVAIYFMSSLLLSKFCKINTFKNRILIAHLIPLTISVITYINVPDNYYAKFFDGIASEFETFVVATTYPLCLIAGISQILWVCQEVKFYSQQSVHILIPTLLILINAGFITFWAVLAVASWI